MAGYVGNDYGKISLGKKSGEVFKKNVDTTNITFDYISNSWKFSITNLTPDVQRLINLGYQAKLQLCRKIPGTTKIVSYGKKSGINTKVKYSHLIGVNGEISLAGNADITSQIISNPQSIDVTDWINSLFIYDNWRTYTRTKAADLNYIDFGWWYRKYSFCLLINNARYGLSPEMCVYSHFPGGRMMVNIDTLATTKNNLEVHIYEI